MNFESLDQKKSKLLNDFLKLSQGKDMEELLPLLLAFADQAKKEKIQFSKEEMNELFAQMKNDMPPADQKKAEILMQLLN